MGFGFFLRTLPTRGCLRSIAVTFSPYQDVATWISGDGVTVFRKSHTEDELWLFLLLQNVKKEYIYVKSRHPSVFKNIENHGHPELDGVGCGYHTVCLSFSSTVTQITPWDYPVQSIRYFHGCRHLEQWRLLEWLRRIKQSSNSASGPAGHQVPYWCSREASDAGLNGTKVAHHPQQTCTAVSCAPSSLLCTISRPQWGPWPSGTLALLPVLVLPYQHHQCYPWGASQLCQGSPGIVFIITPPLWPIKF